MNYITLKNNSSVSLKKIPVAPYSRFMEANVSIMSDNVNNHCVSYFGCPAGGKVRLFCAIAADETHDIYVSSALVNSSEELSSFAAHNPAFEKFEREIHENFGITYPDHPWLKPVRYSSDRADRPARVLNYPFFSSESEELHEVGVGPIHAGIIEPGHFRFICNGEQILHLEIQLGYQHRGIERLFLEKKKILQRSTLAESIAGDTAAGHSAAFVNLWEGLCGFVPDFGLMFQRTLALELERIAMHTGDLSAICTDIAYQLGSSVFGRLRTPVINYFQEWCGNRLAKGLIRAGKTNYQFTGELGSRLIELFDEYEPDFNEMSDRLFKSSSVLARLEKTGVVDIKSSRLLGVVGMAARASNNKRDIRSSHPHDMYEKLGHEPVIKYHGDVCSRSQVRREEISQSIAHIRELLKDIPPADNKRENLKSPDPDTFSISLVEGWRGEICHCAITGGKGELVSYKIKDPSFHNWLALALAVRNNEISDFPICNKSFSLSYCGHDL